MSVVGGRLGVMNDPMQVLARAREAVREVAALRAAGYDDTVVVAACQGIEEIARTLGSAQTQFAGEIDVRSGEEFGTAGLSYRYGYRRAAGFLERLTRVSAPEARRRVTLGRNVRPRRSFGDELLPASFPAVAAAMERGEMNAESALTVTRILDAAERRGAMPENVAIAEEALVESAATLSADLVRTQAEVWGARLDPDGAEPRDERAHARRSATAGITIDGLTPVTLMVPDLDLALIKAAWAESATFGSRPRFLSEEERESATTVMIDDQGEQKEVLVDPRSRTQRQYDVLIGNMKAGLRAKNTGDGGARSLATVNVVITAKDFESSNGVGWIDGIEQPVSAATVRKIACGAGFTPIVLADNGAVIGVGKRQRYFSAKQRKILAVRDGDTCAWPGCTAPPEWLDAHHVVEYEKGGATTIENGILICDGHHNIVHVAGYELRMINGKPYLRAPFEVDPTQEWKPLGINRATLTNEIEPFDF